MKLKLYAKEKILLKFINYINNLLKVYHSISTPHKMKFAQQQRNFAFTLFIIPLRLRFNFP